MALKGDRWEVQEDVSFFGNTVATRGGIVCLITGGSGAALDQSMAVVGYAANPSGLTPIGILMNDFVNYDLTHQHINYYQEQEQINSKARILRKGWAVTNNLVGVPSPGQPAYVGASGNFTPTLVNTVATPRVGMFLSAPDEDGYVKVEVNLP